MKLLLPRSGASLAIALCALAPVTYAKAKHHAAADRQDEIEVVAHLPMTETGPVTHFVETRHYHHEYLYAEHASDKEVTLIDVTAPNHPAMISAISLPSGSSERLVSVVGNAALIQAQDPSPDAQARGNLSDPPSRTYRIMSFADPLHPTVKQEFTGVTAIAMDDERNLIFLANKDGVWVLKQKFAISPEDEALQKSIEHTIFDTP